MDFSSEVALNLKDVLAKLAKAETYYKSLTPLAFVKASTREEIKLKKSNNAATFVEKFFNKFNEEYITIYKESKKVDTDAGTRRSIGDIFRIAYSYLGNKITLEDIICECLKLNKGAKIGINYCYQINKRVYKERGQKNGQYYDSTHYDELGLTKAHYELLLKNI